MLTGRDKQKKTAGVGKHFRFRACLVALSTIVRQTRLSFAHSDV